MAHLDAARAGAALLVLIHHVRILLFVDYSSIAGHSNPFLAAAYLLTSSGRQAVMVFFVLSGFLIANLIESAAAEGRWSVLGYAVRRLIRLLIVLIPALLFTLVLDQFAIAWLPGGHLPSNYSPANEAPLVMFGNLLFQQGILVPTFGSDTPLWSLAYEFWYYVAFPLLYFAVAGRGAWPRRILLAAVGIAVLVFAGQTISLYFIIWLLGAAVALSYRRWGWGFRAPAWLAPVGTLILTAALVGGRFLQTQFLQDLAVALAFTALLVGLRFRPAGRVPALYAVVVAWLAGAAYTVYLVHYPAIVFVRAWLVPSARLQPSLGSAIFGLVVFAGVLAVALTFAQLTERRTNAVRGWVERRLDLAQLHQRRRGPAGTVITDPPIDGSRPL